MGIVGWLQFYFASAVAAMKDAEILKRFLIILCVFREDVRIKYNKWRAKAALYALNDLHTARGDREEHDEEEQEGVAATGAAGREHKRGRCGGEEVSKRGHEGSDWNWAWPGRLAL